MDKTGAKKFYLPSADYIWPHVLNDKVREVVTARGGEIVEEDYHPLDHTDYSEAIEKIMSSGAEVVFNTIVPPGVTPFVQQLYDAGFTRRGGQLVCTYWDENCLGLVQPEQVEGLYGCLDYYQAADDPFSRELLERYDRLYPGGALLTGGSACSGLYRGMRLWEAAVREAGVLDQDEVIRALDHAKIAVGPGGPAEMVPGQHHARMNMYIGQVQGGELRIVEKLGAIDPQESAVAVA
jgi:branched-chain amino acid transport system substrate-binding protein